MPTFGTTWVQCFRMNHSRDIRFMHGERPQRKRNCCDVTQTRGCDIGERFSIELLQRDIKLELHS